MFSVHPPSLPTSALVYDLYELQATEDEQPSCDLPISFAASKTSEF